MLKKQTSFCFGKFYASHRNSNEIIFKIMDLLNENFMKFADETFKTVGKLNKEK